MPATRGNLTRAIQFVGPKKGSGGTRLHAALESATAISRQPGRSRSIVLLTDGISPGGDYPGLTSRMRAANISLSTIGIGNDADFAIVVAVTDPSKKASSGGATAFLVDRSMGWRSEFIQTMG